MDISESLPGHLLTRNGTKYLIVKAHDSTVVSQALVTVAVTGCTNASPPCGVCSYTGPIPN